ncbi:MAG TPA: PP2C family serine/threonine-protein phosphatase [Stellaceae bacterium]|jgi:serine/threonine protein phosphatase PrpC|nr:PP2C family serine/threonine-protein phosphatase [Stellaceae bacterium]
MDAYRWISAGLTRTGPRRRVNEDAVLDRPDLGLWAVADGVGGQAAGDVASHLVLDSLEAAITPLSGASAAQLGAAAEAALLQANEQLIGKARDLGTRSIIASTIACLVADGAHALCLWAGDSRIHLLRDGALYLLTRDHTLVEVASDAADPRARHKLTRAIGAQPDVRLDWASLELRSGDIFLLCSDGITNVLPAAALADGVEVDPEACVVAVTEMAVAAGARDDMSVVMARALS